MLVMQAAHEVLQHRAGAIFETGSLQSVMVAMMIVGPGPTSSSPDRYQTWQRSATGRTMRAPVGHENAAANSAMSASGPSTRNRGGA
jgi:hypothetical protein